MEIDNLGGQSSSEGEKGGNLLKRCFLAFICLFLCLFGLAFFFRLPVLYSRYDGSFVFFFSLSD